MSVRTVLIVALALVFGLAAAVMAGQFVRQRSDGADTVPVVVAAVDIPRFSVVSAEQLKIRNFPKDVVPPGAVSSIEDAVGRVAYVPVVMDEPLHAARLASKGSGRGLAAVIPHGMQAIAIQTPNVAVGVAGFILPGNKVDVLLTSNASNPVGGPSTITLLQHVEILAVDQQVEAPADNKVNAKDMRSVTLLVTPEQASRLALGQSNGTLQLVLRHPEDDKQSKTPRTTLENLGLRAHTVVPSAQSQPLLIRTLHGPREGSVTVGSSSSESESNDPK